MISAVSVDQEFGSGWVVPSKFLTMAGPRYWSRHLSSLGAWLRLRFHCQRWFIPSWREKPNSSPCTIPQDFLVSSQHSGWGFVKNWGWRREQEEVLCPLWSSLQGYLCHFHNIYWCNCQPGQYKGWWEDWQESTNTKQSLWGTILETSHMASL